MISIPVHDREGQSVGSFELDEARLGGEVRPALLKQAYVRIHANRRQGTSATKSRGQVAYAKRKIYRQKGTGNARHGANGVNLMRHGGHGKAKRPRSWRQDMPARMRKLANRNAVLAKAVDGEIRLVEDLGFEKPSTRDFKRLMQALRIDRTCLFALSDVRRPEALSARNVADVDLTPASRLNVFDLLNHRYLLIDRATFVDWLESFAAEPGPAEKRWPIKPEPAMIAEAEAEAAAGAGAGEETE